MIFRVRNIGFILGVLWCLGCSANDKKDSKAEAWDILPQSVAGLDTAIFASGCFWCTEAIFERVKGVHIVESGYSGGTKPQPTYQQVSAGLTNYAEAVQVIYEPDVISYQKLVEIFFASHDPTQLNRQGPDIGKQYRSEIFFRNNNQKAVASKVKNDLSNSGKYRKAIVTRITPFKSFYKAEEYHQNYYELHPDDPYIRNVSKPKVEKFMKEYRSILKEEYK